MFMRIIKVKIAKVVHILLHKLLRKFILVPIVLILIYVLFHYNHVKQKDFHSLDLKYVVVHIDLKGAPPKLTFLKSMLPELKLLGANALLMEYEDMFPYKNNLMKLSKPDHYNMSELKDFLIKANSLDMEIIPLIQTFGHMESILKLDEFKHLRENAENPNSICPSRIGTRQLIRDMMQQVIDFHSSVVRLKHFHIGCDEVWNINSCSDCVKRSLRDHEIFMDHVDTVSSIVWEKNPDLIILIWDDMLRSMELTHWQHFKKRPNIEIVYWMYNEFNKDGTHIPLHFYHKYFQNIWVASAYKGADGVGSAIPDYNKRSINTLSWLELINDYVFGGEEQKHSFKGIILTGWSRYAHFKPLCELLLVSYPCLISSLLLVNKFQLGIQLDRIEWDRDWKSIFDQYFLDDYYSKTGCASIGLNGKFNDACILNSANNVYDSVKQFVDFLDETENVALMTTKNRTISHKWCSTKQKNLIALENNLKLHMKYFYNQDVQNEYINRSYTLHRDLIMCGSIFFKDRYFTYML